MSRRLLLGLAFLAVACSRRVAVGSAADGERLLELHRKVIRAHQTSEIDLILEDERENYVVVNRGDLTHPTRAERRQRLGGFLKHARFTGYEDLAEPIVRVSADGTMGWVIARVHAAGTQRMDDGSETALDYISGWIELYEKIEGSWVRVGNVSNVKP